MDFKQLQSFVTVAECGSFTQAAEQLYLSQPTISGHIQALEKELDRVLMIRTTKRLTITPKGQQVLDYAKRILELEERMVTDCKKETRRILHLGASTIPSAYILPRILPEFGKLYPKTYYVVHKSDSQGVIEGIEDGIFDIGLIGMKADKLTCIPISTDRMVIITPVTPEFLKLASDEGDILQELLKKPMIIRESGSGSHKSAQRFFESMKVYEDDLTVVARVNDQETIKNMVASGLGLSAISYLAAQNFIEERRVLSFELPKSSERTLYLAYRKGFKPEKETKEFMDYICKHA